MNEALPFSKAEIEQSVGARWQRAAAHFSYRPAITSLDGECYSYQHVEAHANRLAQAVLRQLGAENCPIALLLDHSPQLVIAILGVLKANKAYVVLDPGQSVEQLRQRLAASAAPLLFTCAEYKQLAAALVLSGQTILSVEQIADDETTPNLVITADAVAAIFFTSGTSRQPKGVIYTHRMILHRIWVETETLKLDATHRISGLRGLDMAASTRDLFNALLNGGTLCLYPLRRAGLPRFSRWLAAQQITYFHLPILLYRQWLDTLAPTDYFPNLRYIFPSGRKTLTDWQRLWPHLSPSTRLVSTYATTETSLLTMAVLDQQSLTVENPLPVGYPIADKSITLLDRQGQPVKDGDPGEIVVSSRYISAGYWQQPELTSQHFTAVSTDAVPLIRYTTGDIGRWRADGGLELLGRQDSQVKLRGFRVVLDDVEEAIQVLPGVKAAAVTADDERGRLLAYILPATHPPVSATTIRAILAERLPHFAVPTHIIYLENLPLLPSGKIDRMALPLPGRSRPQMDTPFIAPRTELEQQLAGIWGELLDLNEVGVEDSFFELGGDSLTAMRMSLLVEQRFSWPMPTSFYARPTILHLSALISGDELTTGSQPQKPLVRRRHRWISRTERGPQLRGYGLPYGLGVRLHPYWLRLPVVRRSLREQSAIFREWLAWLNIADPDGRKLEHSLLANTWKRWRNNQLLRPEIFTRWGTIIGMNRLEAALATDSPLVVVMAHTGLTRRIFQTILAAKTNRPIFWVGRSRSGLVERMEKVTQAGAVLQQGGIVITASDGVVGKTGVELPFLGRRWLFRAGAAELAEASGATVLPVFITLQPAGRVNITLHPPLTPVATTGPAYVTEVMEQYAHLLAELWRKNLGTIPWLKLRQFAASRRLEETE